MDQCEREQHPDARTPHIVRSKMTGSHQFAAKVRSGVRSNLNVVVLPHRELHAKL
jgi:hypothetical protein